MFREIALATKSEQVGSRPLPKRMAFVNHERVHLHELVSHLLLVHLAVQDAHCYILQRELIFVDRQWALALLNYAIASNHIII